MMVQNLLRASSRRFLFIIFSMLITLMHSCVEHIEMDPEEKMPVIVNCVLENTDTQHLDLYYAKRPLQSSRIPIENAEVSITGGGGKYSFEWNGEYYESKMRPKAGAFYSLNISISGKDSISARTRYPQKIYVIRDGFSRGEGSVDFGPAGYYSIGTNSTADHKLLEDVTVWVTPEIVKYVAVPWEEVPFMYDYVVVDSLQVDGIFTDHAGVDDFNVGNKKWENVVDMTYMENYYFGYLNQWEKYKAHCMGLPMYGTFLRIIHTKTFEGLTIGNDNGYFILFPYADFKKYPGYSPRYRFRVLSEEYDKYLRDIVCKKVIHGDEFSTYYSPEDVYTNIENGRGIFGAVYELE